MTVPLYEFSCPQRHRTEAIRPVHVTVMPCPDCGQTAFRESVYLNAQVGRVRTPVAERTVSLKTYQEASEMLADQHAREEDRAQRTLPQPSLWRAAKQRAEKLQAGGITDSLDYRPEYIRD